MPSALALSAKGASFLILVQIGSRALTFVINQLLLRHLSPKIFGVSTQLELYTITTLYFSRESFRIALQRPTSNTQDAVNVAYIPLLLSLPISVFLAGLYLQSKALASIQSVHEAFVLTGLSSIIELAAEPCFAVVQQYLLFSIRARAEASAAIARCVATYLAVSFYKGQQNGVGALPFAVGLLSSATTYFATYYALTAPIAKREKFSLLPKKLTETSVNVSEYIGGYFSRSLCSLSLNLYLQSGVKYVLTQGDSLLITSLASLHDQGSYALATNYGSLIARTIFQPIEESSRNLFAKLCLPARASAEPAAGPAKGQTDNSSRTETQSSPQDENKDTVNFNYASQVLSRFLHLYAIVSLLSISLGPPLAPILLHLVVGTKWTATNAPQVLATYTYYIPFLAVNGVTEAFVAAVASNAELRQQSTFLLVNFAAFAIAAWGFVSRAGMGAQGLVWACCVALAGRCMFNAFFIRRFFREKRVRIDVEGMIPSAGCLAAAVAVIGVVRMEKYAPGVLHDHVLDQLLGICALAAVMGIAILVFERGFLWSCYRMIFPGA